MVCVFFFTYTRTVTQNAKVGFVRDENRYQILEWGELSFEDKSRPFVDDRGMSREAIRAQSLGWCRGLFSVFSTKKVSVEFWGGRSFDFSERGFLRESKQKVFLRGGKLSSSKYVFEPLGWGNRKSGSEIWGIWKKGRFYNRYEGPLKVGFHFFYIVSKYGCFTGRKERVGLKLVLRCVNISERV